MYNDFIMVYWRALTSSLCKLPENKTVTKGTKIIKRCAVSRVRVDRQSMVGFRLGVKSDGVTGVECD